MSREKNGGQLCSIMCIFQQPEGSENDGWWDGPGWYFPDEAERLHGPFSSLEEAFQAQCCYAKELL